MRFILVPLHWVQRKRCFVNGTFPNPWAILQVANAKIFILFFFSCVFGSGPNYGLYITYKMRSLYHLRRRSESNYSPIQNWLLMLLQIAKTQSLWRKWRRWWILRLFLCIYLFSYLSRLHVLHHQTKFNIRQRTGTHPTNRRRLRMWVCLSKLKKKRLNQWD